MTIVKPSWLILDFQGHSQSEVKVMCQRLLPVLTDILIRSKWSRFFFLFLVFLNDYKNICQVCHMFCFTGITEQVGCRRKVMYTVSESYCISTIMDSRLSEYHSGSAWQYVELAMACPKLLMD